MLTDDGPLHIEIPRDRKGLFDPLLIGKHERRFTGFDDKIISMYARGMTVRDVQDHLREMYEVDVSPEFISSVTDAVISEVTTWQNRPLETMYPVVFLTRCVKIPPTARCATRRSTSRWGCLPTARATFWGCGSKIRKARNSG